MSRNSILENVIILALLGVLAGGVAGLAIGAVTGRSPSASSSSGAQ